MMANAHDMLQPARGEAWEGRPPIPAKFVLANDARALQRSLCSMAAWMTEAR
jgi:hypothetical protein